jgi:hypothetical protein|tara:strand:+ start:36 stop:779 length:744 start_codon:yes stop_codon:yes gene_type:complete
MGEPINGQRNLKQPYRNKGFQIPYSLAGDAVDPNPPPPSSYSTTTHVATSAHREGLTSPVQQRPVRSRFGDRSALMRYNNLITPWHLYPKADSANIIERQKKSTGTVIDGAASDIFAVYLTDSGASATGATLNAAGRPNLEFWRIKKFGHAELNGVTGITYQILIDGQIALAWDDFQLSPSSPYNQLFEFENPIVVKESIIFRVVNNSGGTYDFSAAGNAVDGIFSGWTEQYVASSDTDHTDITMPA